MSSVSQQNTLPLAAAVALAVAVGATAGAVVAAASFAFGSERWQKCAPLAMTTPDEDEAEKVNLPPASAGQHVLVFAVGNGADLHLTAHWIARSREAGAHVQVLAISDIKSRSNTISTSRDMVVVELRDRARDSDTLVQVFEILRPGEKLIIVAQKETSPVDATRTLTFAGAIDTKVVLSAENGPCVVEGKKASWALGASAPVKLPFSTKRNSATTSAVNPTQEEVTTAQQAKTWTLSMNDDTGDLFGGASANDDDDDLVDEDALLEASAPVKRPATQDGAECATKRRACKNCSCGRAELEREEEQRPSGTQNIVKPLVIDNVDDIVTSACGNCSKGDAFRCGGCPFLGKPAFEKGQEKLVMLSDLDSQQDT